VEEESSVGEIVDQLRFADGKPAAVLMLDRKRSGRPPEHRKRGAIVCSTGRIGVDIGTIAPARHKEIP
jgi:hypothetical protein